MPRKQILTARSSLELPPIIKHQAENLHFFHPCLRISPLEAGSLEDLSPNSADAIFVELRCSFHANGGKRKKQHVEVGKTLAIAPGVQRPPLGTKPAQEGVLCIQV